WINQFPCARCVVDPNGRTVTASLTQLGEYMLAAVAPPTPSLTIATTPIQVTVGTAFADAVATFTPIDPLDSLSKYPAVITWGDGQSSSASLSKASGGRFVISGAHTWNAAGTVTVDVALFVNGVPQIAHTTATVAPSQTPPQFTAAAPPLTGTEGVAYTY